MVSLSHKLTSPLSKEKHTLAQSPPPPPVPSLSSKLHRLDGTLDKNFSFPLFPSPNLPIPSVSHHTMFHATSLPHSLLALNDTVYTHPASIIPFHTSPGLFICLGCWGDMKAHSLVLSLSHPLLPSFLLFSSPTSAGCSWQLIYEGLLNPSGRVWSTLGETGSWRGSVVKTQVIYSSTWRLILLGLVKISLEAASAKCSISLHALPSVPVCVCNKCLQVQRWGWQKQILLLCSQRARLGDLCNNRWQLVYTCHLPIQYVHYKRSGYWEK